MAAKINIKEALGHMNPWSWGWGNSASKDAPKVREKRRDRFTTREGDKIARDVLKILRNNPYISDEELQDALNLPDTANYQISIDTGRSAYKKEQLLSTKSTPDTGTPTTTGNTDQAPAKAGDTLQLVNFTPEQLVKQVDDSLQGVNYGMSTTRSIKENISEAWSLFAPIVLFLGTVGEVYFFIYNNMTLAGHTPEWWVSVSILASVCALEFSFMVVSMKSDVIRNDVREKGAAATRQDKKELRNHLISWFVLAVGVAIGQVSFLVVSMMGGMNNVPFLIAFSVGRSVFTLAADFYVAYVHKEKPTTAEQDYMKRERRAKAATAALEQKSREVTIINDGILRVRDSQTEAEIKEDRQRTRLTIEKKKNANDVTLLEAQFAQTALFTGLQNNLMRAVFDPTMAPEDRKMILSTMDALGKAAKLQLPKPGQTRINEESSGDL